MLCLREPAVGCWGLSVHSPPTVLPSYAPLYATKRPPSTQPAGEMSDAGELLLVLYEHIKSAAPPAAAAAVDAAFGLRVAEAVRCSKCGMATHKGRYTQVRGRRSRGRQWGGEMRCCAGRFTRAPHSQESHLTHSRAAYHPPTNPPSFSTFSTRSPTRCAAPCGWAATPALARACAS